MKTINLKDQKNKLAELIEVSPEDHSIFIYEAGLTWLDFHFSKCPDIFPVWERSKAFWDWWKLQYNARCFEALMIQGYSLETKASDLTENEKDDLVECFTKLNEKTCNIYPAEETVFEIRPQIEKKNKFKREVSKC